MQTNTDVRGEALRNVMRRVPSPVVVVTAFAGEARGSTIGSFTSVSLVPPLISFNVALESQMHRVITKARRFAVHILAEHQADVYQRFATAELRSDEQFAAMPHRAEADGLPVLTEAEAVLFCRPFAIHSAGDHSIIIGEVEGVSDNWAASPLVYYNRSYRGLGEVIVPRPRISANLASSESPITPAPNNA